MKTLYRKARSLCHPDKVSEAHKSAAHRVFVELQEAYKDKDLAKVREIQQTLSAKGLQAIRSTSLSARDALKATLAELEYAIARLVQEHQALQASAAVQLMEAADTDWQPFFAQQRKALERELAALVAAIEAEEFAENAL